MSVAERKLDHTVEGCILRDAAGDTLESLWGITDATDAYRRTVEAELALEADATGQLAARAAALATEIVSGVLGEAFV
jgi:hypothetical protein